VSLANRMALASAQVTAICVEANEFPRLSAQFGVRSVPRTVINRSQGFVGALPEQDFVATALQLAGVPLEEPPAETSGESTVLAG
jgi:thioredoxin-like negative regulator of GroEL